MNKSQVSKINESSLQVLKTLQILLEGNFTMNELMDKLNQNNNTKNFNNSVISKYINTCRYSGIEIPKVNNRYYVTNLPFGFELSKKEIALINYLDIVAKDKLSLKLNNIFNSFMHNLIKYSNKKTINIEQEMIKVSYQVFQKAIKEKRKILITSYLKNTIECIPLSISDSYDSKIFNVLYKGEEKSISSKKINSIQILNEKYNKEEYNVMVTVFKLTGDLAKRYEVRENEQISVNSLPDFIIIENRGEDKTELLRRLLRYDTCCEIITPKFYRNDMKNLIENMLKNYEG